MINSANQLDQLKTLFKEIVETGRDLSSLGFNCYCERTALETMHEIFYEPSLIIVLTGSLKATIGSTTHSLKKGDMLASPATEIYFSSEDISVTKSSWVVISFKKELLSNFKNLYGELLTNFDYVSNPHDTVSPVMINVVYQWLYWEGVHHMSGQLIIHRQLELLLLLVESGIGKSIFFVDSTNWKNKVRQLLGIDPGLSWNIKEVSTQLGVSVATLRRRLKDEATSFQGLLEEVRLDSGFKYLRKTDWKIGRISLEVGYQSQSRFGERFKLRYGVNPSDIRKDDFELLEALA
ncbi:MAG: AraC-like DNA-binding protein [Alteromonadaceae bacterium]|jgi:AraC-like DNA-binding protein